VNLWRIWVCWCLSWCVWESYHLILWIYYFFSQWC
jgi:hypothetical protein